MTDFYDYDPSSGYQPSGGWGYHDFEGAAGEASHNADVLRESGDTYGASEWDQIASDNTQQAHDTYVAGGPGYGSGGDTSGFNDGTYYGQGATGDASTAADTSADQGSSS